MSCFFTNHKILPKCNTTQSFFINRRIIGKYPTSKTELKKMRNVKNIIKDMRETSENKKFPFYQNQYTLKQILIFIFFMVNKNVFNGKRTNLKQKQIGFVSFLCSLSSYFCKGPSTNDVMVIMAFFKLTLPCVTACQESHPLLDVTLNRKSHGA